MENSIILSVQEYENMKSKIKALENTIANKEKEIEKVYSEKYHTIVYSVIYGGRRLLFHKTKKDTAQYIVALESENGRLTRDNDFLKYTLNWKWRDFFTTHNRQFWRSIGVPILEKESWIYTVLNKMGFVNGSE